MIAALFVAKGGAYYGIEGVDPWPEERDARLYDGPYPVVAHPPCQLWVNFAALNFKRYGGEHIRPGNDGGCFASALANVRRVGGVLEHPAGSTSDDGRRFSFEMSGFARCGRARTGTELASARGFLYVGARHPPALSWQRKPGTAQVGWFDRIKPTLSKKEAMSTPPDFRDELIGLARWSVLRRERSTG